jgi:hypothetical protein
MTMAGILLTSLHGQAMRFVDAVRQSRYQNQGGRVDSDTRRGPGRDHGNRVPCQLLNSVLPKENSCTY